MHASDFVPTHLDCRQWAKAAKAANMSYGCLTTKHHSGFCIWDTKTTDYNSMQSPAPECRVKQHRLPPVIAERVRITITRHQGEVALSEVGVY